MGFERQDAGVQAVEEDCCGAMSVRGCEVNTGGFLGGEVGREEELTYSAADAHDYNNEKSGFADVRQSCKVAVSQKSKQSAAAADVGGGGGGVRVDPE